MPVPPLEEMRIVASRLKPLNVPFAFVGGAVMCLLVDHPELTDFRRTKDVDVVVAAITYFEFAALEARLREAGFQHDTSEGAPICRWIDRSRGSWPPLMQESDRNEYSLALIKHWMTEFLGRFFRSQFKRSVAVNGPKVGSGGSLSPRGDWRAPSDAEARAWLDEAGSVPE